MRHYSLCFNQVDVPRANAVAVVVGDDWTQLETNGSPTSSIWEGDVNMSEYWGRESKVFVCANYGSVSSSYHTLLEYTIWSVTSHPPFCQQCCHLSEYENPPIAEAFEDICDAKSSSSVISAVCRLSQCLWWVGTQKEKNKNKYELDHLREWHIATALQTLSLVLLLL